MTRYRIKPVTIEAMQLVGSTAELYAVYQWIEDGIGSVPPPCDDERGGGPKPGVTIDPADGQIVIRTLEGDMKADLGDWIIRGVQGEFYPCKPDIFAATYEAVDCRGLMPRLQILELPEGADDQRPPFALVIDQADDAIRDSLAVTESPLADGLVTKLGARAVLVFDTTVDIPANQVPVGPDGLPVRFRVEADFQPFREQVRAEATAASNVVAGARYASETYGNGVQSGAPSCRYCGADCTDGRSWDGGIRYACARCADWRAKLNDHKRRLTDALGMDRLRDWDDIVNAARGLRSQLDQQNAALEAAQLALNSRTAPADPDDA